MIKARENEGQQTDSRDKEGSGEDKQKVTGGRGIKYHKRTSMG